MTSLSSAVLLIRPSFARFEATATKCSTVLRLVAWSTPRSYLEFELTEYVT